MLGADGLVQEVTSHVTVNVKAVNVLSEPFVGLKTAIRLCVPMTVPSGGLI